jgi:hypothetical protein
MEDLEKGNWRAGPAGYGTERLSGSILGLRGDAVNCGLFGGAAFPRFLDRDTIQETRVFKVNAQFGTAEAVPFRRGLFVTR